MVKTLMSVFGSKVSLYAILASVLLVAGMWGYIRYQSAVNAKQSLELAETKEDVRDRDERIDVLNQETEQFVARVREVNAAMQRFQSFVARNTAQRKQDFDSIVSPAPRAGEPADTTAMENRANAGMNGLFDNVNDMTRVEEKK